MSDDLYEQVKRNPKFHQLIARRSKFAWTLAIIILVLYFTFILLIAFAPNWLGILVSQSSVITIGIPLGLCVIVIAFVLTGIYVYRANTEFDRLNNEIIAELKQ